MDIIRVTNEHIEEIARIHIASWRKAYVGIVSQSHLDSLSLEKRIAKLNRFLAENTFEAYTGLVDEQIVGFVSIGPAKEDDINAAAGELMLIYLDPQFWSMGFGTKLANHALDIFSDRGYNTAVLWAFEKNVRADGFYRSLGFAKDGKSVLLEKFDNAKSVRYIKRLI